MTYNNYPWTNPNYKNTKDELECVNQINDYEIEDGYMLTFNEYKDKILLEFFDFQTNRVYKVLDLVKASEVFPQIWNQTGAECCKLKYILSLYTWDPEETEYIDISNNGCSSTII